MNTKNNSILLIFLIALVILSGCTSPAAATAPTPTSTEITVPNSGAKIILATTTSTEDSGLLEVILPNFEKQCGCKVEVVAVGTGQAIQLGVDGNADVLLVHDRAKEEKFMTDGNGVRREDVMYNDFVIVGPESDPAGIKNLTSASEAFKKIQETQSKFVSRGDDSGTNSKEKSIWKAANITPEGDWYVSAGQGMGAVLTMADEMKAYTLSDRATFLARTSEGSNLRIMVERDKALFNPYGVIAVNPAKNPSINADLSTKFIDWIISVPTQKLIGEFGNDKFGQSLFTPDSAVWSAQ